MFVGPCSRDASFDSALRLALSVLGLLATPKTQAQALTELILLVYSKNRWGRAHGMEWNVKRCKETIIPEPWQVTLGRTLLLHKTLIGEIANTRAAGEVCSF